MSVTLAAAASGASHGPHRRGAGDGPRACSGGSVSSWTLRPTAASASMSRSSVLVMTPPQCAGQRAEAPGRGGLHRAGRDAEHRRDLGLAQAEVVAQDEHLPAAAWQRGERGEHLPAALGLDHFVLGGLVRQIRHRGSGAAETAQHSAAAHGCPAPVEHAGAHVGQLIAAWPRPVPPGVQRGEHVLDGVLGRRPVPDQHHRKPDQFRVVLAEDRGDIDRLPARGRVSREPGPPGPALAGAAVAAKRMAHT